MSLINSHGLDEPTADDFLTSLSMVLPAADINAMVQRACLDLELPTDRLTALAPDQLRALVEHLTQQRGLASIVARSFIIRLDSYTALADRTQHA